eukprot:GHRQ01037579.1.p1 GENE.GHRQ01037579.1~~GHRQ01037579.1.p1  ORF type:complete len:146 (+),score=22.22 GHRQ01037579.1:276-713(+)
MLRGSSCSTVNFAVQWDLRLRTSAVVSKGCMATQHNLLMPVCLSGHPSCPHASCHRCCAPYYPHSCTLAQRMLLLDLQHMSLQCVARRRCCMQRAHCMPLVLLLLLPWVAAGRRARIGPHHFLGSTGYGHGDLGREALDQVNRNT